MSTPTLICDDSAMARKQMMRAIPAQWDAQYTMASNGKEALDAIRAGLGELVFLDLTMPEVDGFEVLQTVHDENLKSLIIVVSADIQPQAQQRVMQLGALAFLRKPVDPQALFETMKTCGLIL